MEPEDSLPHSQEPATCPYQILIYKMEIYFEQSRTKEKHFAHFFMSWIFERIKQRGTKALIVTTESNLRAEEHYLAFDLWQMLMMSAECKYLQLLLRLSQSP
jgi:hypothetical protein